MTETACLLCGNPKLSEVRVSLARWRDPQPYLFSAIPRCIDRAKCRERCEALGDPWAVIDPGEYAPLPRTVMG